MPDSVSVRTRTPSHLKWLLTQRAMLQGEVDQREQRIHRLAAEVSDFKSQIHSLDETMALFAPHMNPSAAGSVKRIAGKYGKAGGLTDFILEQLQQVGAGALSTVQLSIKAGAKFGIDLALQADRDSYCHTVRRVLAALLEAGKIEVVTAWRGGPKSTTWRMKQQVSLASLGARLGAKREGGEPKCLGS